MLQSLRTILPIAVLKAQQFDYEKFVLVAVALHTHACVLAYICTCAPLLYSLHERLVMTDNYTI
jgi:hypothetical protein